MYRAAQWCGFGRRSECRQTALLTASLSGTSQTFTLTGTRTGADFFAFVLAYHLGQQFFNPVHRFAE